MTAPFPDLRRARLETLDNGLRVCLLPKRQAGLVSTVVAYRVGAADEARGRGGAAHFLEHMMFKGSESYPQGEIDRRTQRLGGANNAFTSHDATVYYFQFAADRWHEALAMESDRMRGLILEAQEVDLERSVIEEEISQYDNDPWAALEQEVMRARFGAHPYARPVLGSVSELRSMESGYLRRFHRRFYRPDNAVLVVAGGFDDDALERIDACFGAIPQGAPRRARGSTPRPPRRGRSLERRSGETTRLLLSMPAPAVDHRDHPALRLLSGLLSSGRASRLHRDLVEEQRLCSWVAVELSDAVHAGYWGVALEGMPGVAAQQIETALRRALRPDPPIEAVELRRAKKIYSADWIFNHERLHEQAIGVASALLRHDLEFPQRYLEAVRATRPEALAAAWSRWLDLEGAVWGWSLPAGGKRRSP